MRRFLLASVAALAAVCRSAVRLGADPQGRHAFRSQGARSDLERRLHRAQSRLHALRHAVRDGRAVPDQAADGRHLEHERRRAHLDLQAARRAGMARRHAGHRRGLRRLAEALGGARFDGPEALAVAAGLQGRRSQDLPDGVQGEVRAGARIARQALRRRALHHAQARRRDRPLQADRGLHGLRAPSSSRRTNGSPARRRSISRTPSTSRGLEPCLRPGRRQGGQPRPRRMGVDPGHRDPGQRPAQGRDRHDRDRQLRHAAGAGEGQECARHHRAAPPTSTSSA